MLKRRWLRGAGATIMMVLAACTEVESPETTRVVRELAAAIADGDTAAARGLIASDELAAASDGELARVLGTQMRLDPDAIEVFDERVIGDHVEAQVRLDGRVSPRTLVFVGEAGELRLAPSGPRTAGVAEAPKWWVGNDRPTTTAVLCALAGDYNPTTVGLISPWTSQEEFCPTWTCGILGSQCSRFSDAAWPWTSITCVNQWIWLDADYFLDEWGQPRISCIRP